MKLRIVCFALCLCAAALAQEGASPSEEQVPSTSSGQALRPAQDDHQQLTGIGQPALSEVEQLKGENVRLKLDSLDKQMRLMQEQYARLQEAQRALVGELQALDAEILRARGLPMQEHRVNWQEGKIEPTTPRTGAPAARQENKQ